MNNSYDDGRVLLTQLLSIVGRTKTKLSPECAAGTWTSGPAETDGFFTLKVRINFWLQLTVYTFTRGYS